MVGLATTFPPSLSVLCRLGVLAAATTVFLAFSSLDFSLDFAVGVAFVLAAGFDDAESFFFPGLSSSSFSSELLSELAELKKGYVMFLSWIHNEIIVDIQQFTIYKSFTLVKTPLHEQIWGFTKISYSNLDDALDAELEAEAALEAVELFFLTGVFFFERIFAAEAVARAAKDATAAAPKLKKKI